MQAFRVEKEAETLAAVKKQKRGPGQLSLEAVKRMRTRCTHDFVRMFPSGPWDNGEYHYACRLCAAVRE